MWSNHALQYVVKIVSGFLGQFSTHGHQLATRVMLTLGTFRKIIYQVIIIQNRLLS